MRRVLKKDLALYDKKSIGVVIIKGGITRLSILNMIFFSIGAMLLTMSIMINVDNQLESKPTDYSLMITASVLVVASIIMFVVRKVVTRDPNIYFINNEMYIKENKNSYIQVQPCELDGYSFAPFSASNYAGMGLNSRRMATCSYWGEVTLVINGNAYTFGCSSMKKTKHYLDGFNYGKAVIENPFDGDALKKIDGRSYAALVPSLAPFLIFFVLMFYCSSSVTTIISLILACVTGLALVILFIVMLTKAKYAWQLHREYYAQFVTNSCVDFRTDNLDDISQYSKVYNDTTFDR